MYSLSIHNLFSLYSLFIHLSLDSSYSRLELTASLLPITICSFYLILLLNIFLRSLQVVIILFKIKFLQFIRKFFSLPSHNPDYFSAGLVASRSYLSFQFALSFYGIIPEAVYVCTSASERNVYDRFFFSRKKSYSYKKIPKPAFECAVNLFYEEGISFRIASPEKALCDTLFFCPPVRTIRDMRELLDDYMRIDFDALLHFNLNIIKKLASLYPSENVRKLALLIERERICTKI